QEAGGEVLQPAAGHDVEAEHDEAGQVLVRAAQAVVDPRAEARPAGVVAAGVQEQYPGRVQRQVRLHGADGGQVVGAGGDVREQLADRQAAFAVAIELPGALQPAAVLVGGRVVDLARWLPIQLGQLRLRVKRVDLRDAAVREAEDDVLRPAPRT